MCINIKSQAHWSMDKIAKKTDVVAKRPRKQPNSMNQEKQFELRWWPRTCRSFRFGRSCRSGNHDPAYLRSRVIPWQWFRRIFRFFLTILTNRVLRRMTMPFNWHLPPFSSSQLKNHRSQLTDARELSCYILLHLEAGSGSSLLSHLRRSMKPEFQPTAQDAKAWGMSREPEGACL